MGKASKWMINFLLGRKDEKEKKKNISFPTTEAAANPNIKRRWSFGRSTNKEKTHKSSKSFDTSVVTPLMALTNHHRNDVPATKAAERITRAIENAAAVKIQAFFRSHLAKKALCALKSLVKLQALARGHLVRKRTTATLRGMHALMAIQVRARFQRIQMNDETQFVSKSSRHGHFQQENTVERAERKSVDDKLYETLEVLRRKNSNVNHSQKRAEHGFSINTINENHYEISKTIPSRASFSFQHPTVSRHEYQYQPNYMAKTESSRAKVRSQSEPKQRPKIGFKPESKQLTSSQAQAQAQSQAQGRRSASSSSQYSNLKEVAHENRDPWFIKLYRSARSDQDSEQDCSSTVTTNSNFVKNSYYL